MMLQEYSKLSLLLCCLLTAVRTASSACVTGNFVLSIKAAKACNYTYILPAFTTFYKDPINVSPNGACAGVTAEKALWQLLQATDATTAQARVFSICAEAFASYSKNVVSFDQVVRTSGSSQATSLNFVKNFFTGRTDWNEEYETLYGSSPTGLNATNILSDDADVVNTQYYAAGQYGKIVFPRSLPHFSNCQANSVYCCWTADRQPNDGNGNCQYPTDSECVDADPADNTNLCLVQHAAGSSSTTWKSGTGSFIFNGDDQDGEGPIHCHGFAWDEFNQNDPSFIYRGNNLFYISMYDHLYARGYVRNVPGAPMCACAEQMPVVSRSDCTQMAVTQDFKFTFQNGAFTAEVVNIDIAYSACKGFDRTGKEMNNDLWAYYNRLFYEGRVSASKFAAFSQHVLIQDLCRLYEKVNMAPSGLTVGYKSDKTWYQVAGREAAALPYVIGKSLFNLLFASSGQKIIRRTCPGCIPSHQNIYYRRLTTVPDSLDLLTALLSQHEPIDGQTYGTDFVIFPTYTDAVSNINAWPCNYTADLAYPGNCGPTLNGMYEDQSSAFDWASGRSDVGFYVQASAVSKALVKRPTVHIGRTWKYGRQTYSGAAFVYRNNIYMTGVGIDIWDREDSADFSGTQASGDITVTVQVSSFIAEQGWAKAGLDIRASNAPGSIHFGGFLTLNNSACAIWREQTEDYTQIDGNQDNVHYPSIFLKVQKVGNTFNAFKSLDNAMTWTLLNQNPVIISNFPSVFQVGLAMATSWSSVPAESIFSNYTVK